ncbi:MAG: hypothetical protein AAGM84_17810 [Pseudomonadota bacterium]
MVWVGFALAFVIGPLVFLALVRHGRTYVPYLVVGAAGLMAAALWLGGAIALLPLWGAWILACASFTIVGMRFVGRGSEWVRALGAVATTAPWFGFAAVQLSGA